MTSVTADAVASWRKSIGRSERRTEKLSVENLRRYALAIGGDPDVEKVQPALAHWAYFLPGPSDDQIGPDGHAKRGGFMPAVTLPRRMFAGAALHFTAPLVLDEDAELVDTIADVAHKSGRSGDLVFVEVERTLVQQDEVRVRERRRFVYRGEDTGSIAATMPVPTAEPIAGDIWDPTPVNLFRFSAVTFNSHRIHYDAPYAMGVEGYPALVVHGPFTAAMLASLAARAGTLTKFDFRAQAPLYQGQPIRLQADANEVRAVRADGAIAMIATVEYA